MRNRLLSYFSDDFLRHNAVFFVGSIAVAILNYAYHPIISRLLSIEEFGEVQDYISLAIQLGVIATVFGMIILNIKANSETNEKQETINQLYTLSTITTIIIAVGLIILAPYIGAALNLSGYLGFLLIACIILISTPRTFAKFHLQATKMFGKASLTELIVAGGKIFFAVIFILIGTKVFGALAGFFVATLAGLLYVYPYTKKTIAFSNFSCPRFSPLIKRELRYGILILFAISFTTFFYTADIIVVRYFFDAETAGLYAGIATVARIIVFATGSVAAVTIAHIKLKNTREENHHIMRKALLLVGTMAVAILAVFTLFPALVIKILMGESFLPLADFLPVLSLLMVVVAITNLFVMYFLSLRHYALIAITTLSSLLIISSTFLWHNTIFEIIMSFLAGTSLTLIILAIMYMTERENKNLEKIQFQLQIYKND